MHVFSSEVYHIAPRDIAVLNDGDIKVPLSEIKDEVVVLLGHNPTLSDFDAKDTLIKGRERVLSAMQNKEEFIPVRFVFVPGNKRYDILSPFIRKLRYRIRYYGSNVYHLNPRVLREMKIERSEKSRKNAYSFTNRKYRMTQSERDNEWDRIRDSIKQNGFNDDEPIDIMLCRMSGSKDCVNNGHHRIGIALELQLNEIPVRFSAAGTAPTMLRPFLRFFSTVNLAFKRRFGH